VEEALASNCGYDVSEAPAWVDGLKQIRDAKYPEKHSDLDGWTEKKFPRLGVWEPDPPLASPELEETKSAEQKFMRLRDEWKAHRGHHSDTVTLVMHPAYQSIIGMGSAAIPFLLRELAIHPDRWYWALRAITEADPVPEEARGNSRAMAQAWLEWGKERGYQW